MLRPVPEISINSAVAFAVKYNCPPLNFSRLQRSRDGARRPVQLRQHGPEGTAVQRLHQADRRRGQDLQGFKQ